MYFQNVTCFFFLSRQFCSSLILGQMQYFHPYSKLILNSSVLLSTSSEGGEKKSPGTATKSTFTFLQHKREYLILASLYRRGQDDSFQRGNKCTICVFEQQLLYLPDSFFFKNQHELEGLCHCFNWGYLYTRDVLKQNRSSWSALCTKHQNGAGE